MIADFVAQLNDIDIAEFWFQKNSVTCHTTRDTINLLRETFDGSKISCNGPMNRPPKSCDKPQTFCIGAFSSNNNSFETIDKKSISRP